MGGPFLKITGALNSEAIGNSDTDRVSSLINACNIDCRNIYAFAMDEYADEKGNIAPESWEFSFTNAMMRYFYYEIDKKLRPPKDHFVGFTNENLKEYGKMIDDLGGADICYSGPGWTGHLAFIEPDAPEFQGTLEEWKNMSARIVTLSPFTLAQNSLHGCACYYRTWYLHRLTTLYLPPCIAWSGHAVSARIDPANIGHRRVCF